MYKWMENRLFKKTLDKIEKAAVIYRYISWLVTSAFYLSEPRMDISFKIGVVAALFIAMVISAKIYINLRDGKLYYFLVFAEVIGISFLIIPTGGLNSPFIWYALNPILNAALSDRPLLCWTVNLVFLAGITVMSTVFFRPLYLSTILYGIRPTALIFILITVAIRLSSKILKTLSSQAEILRQQKKELMEANAQLEESIDHITSLYHMTEALTVSTAIEQMIHIFLVYAKRIVKGDIIALLIKKDRLGYQLLEDDLFIIYKDDIPIINRQAFKDIMLDYINNLDGGQTIIERDLDTIEPGHVLMTGITSGGCCYGALALFGNEVERDSKCQHRTMAFLGSMCGVAIDRIKSVDMQNHVLLAEEQKRISNEMHDVVSHNLFSIIYCSQQLLNTTDMAPERMREKLTAIRDTASIAAKELRKCIYNLNNKDVNYFEIMGVYLGKLKVLNNLDIHFKNGLTHVDMPSPKVQYSIYRLVREAVGNGVHHGKCSKIKIDISRAGNDIKVLVEDNGIGFNIKDTYGENKGGLGLTNIHAVARSAGGRVDIQSHIGRGTRLTCTIPINDTHAMDNKEVVG